MNKYIFIFSFFLFLSNWRTIAQEHIFKAQTLTTEDGLSNLLTIAVHKDRKGFLWVSTPYGLNRYDGYEFKLYTKEKNGLQFNEPIQKITEDDEGNIWLFYNTSKHSLTPKNQELKGVDIFNPNTNKAVPFDDFFKGRSPIKSKNLRLSNIIDPFNRLWLTTGRGQLFLFQKGRFQKIFEQKNSFFQHITVSETDQIWLADKNQLTCIDTTGRILNNLDLPQMITGIWAGKNDRIWLALGNWGNEKEVDLISPENKLNLWTLSPTEDLKPFHLVNAGIPLVFEANEGIFLHRSLQGLWFVSVENQLLVFNQEGEHIYNFHSLFGIDLEINFHNYFEDGEYIWLSTPIGLLRVGVVDNPFKLIHKNEGLSNCRGIAEDDSGNIYFHNNGVFCFSPENQSVKKISDFKGSNSIVYTDSFLLTSVYDNSAFCRQIDLRNYEVFDYNTQSGLTTAILPLKNSSEFLLGCLNDLALVNIHTKDIIPFLLYNGFELLKTSKIYFFHKNRAGIWMATNNGIFLMNEYEGILRHFSKDSGDLPFDDIRHIHEDKEGSFWLATRGGGIIRWKPGFKETESSISNQMTIAEGLSNNFIYAIYEDDFDNLWITSDNGLMCMDKETLETRTYLTEDGLPHNEFNFTSHFQAKDGTLYFGGLGGLISFHPKEMIELSEKPIPMQFTDFYVLEKQAEKITRKTDEFRRSNKIAIKPSDKFFEAHFTLLDFDDPERHRYAYKIEGFSDRWQYINENYVRITNLPYGNYKLKIKGQNTRNGWSQKELIVNLEVLKPFYLKAWFIITCLFALITSIILIWKGKVTKLAKDKQRLEAEVLKRTYKIEKDKQIIEQQARELFQLDKAKTQFFSNITHEFRTPLTLITGPLEQVLPEIENNSIRQKISGVIKNGYHLLTLINQLLDLSKLEGGKMKVETVHGDIVNYTKDLVSRFQPLAERKEQRLGFVTDLHNWETHFDKNKWDKIVYNLLSNAMKFTPSEGAIQLSLKKVAHEEKELIQMTVQDSGVGLEMASLEQIFNRFYQVDGSSTRTEEGTGIGLALVKELVELQSGKISVSSQVGMGTSFEVYLPALNKKRREQATVLPPVESTPIQMPFETEESFPFIPPTSSNKEERLALLIIEDNDEIRSYTRQCIDPTKYKIYEAKNGEEGIQKALEIIPDLIISDVMMPKMNGFEVLSSIRSNISTSHIPIILLTAKASLDSRLQGLQRGADAYLTKPFSPQEMAMRIEKLIELRQLLQQRYSNMEITKHDSFNKKETSPILNSEPSQTFEKENEFITLLKAFITENIDNPDLNGDLIGKQFALSRMQLHRKLKALINKSTSELIRSIRLELAYQLIQQKKFSLSEITYMTGFSSPSHFSRTFKKEFGKSPSEII